MLDTLKNALILSWTYIKYLWAIWFMIFLVLVYYFLGPFKIKDNFAQASIFVNTLTPKFYVALTGTSSLISGLILIFEWYYFKKNNCSFIEQFSLNHLSPFFSPQWSGSDDEGDGSVNDPDEDLPPISLYTETRTIVNPMCLFRGSEYQRYLWSTGKQPLTWYDMNQTAQEHQKRFMSEDDVTKPEFEHMRPAWTEMNPKERIFQAHRALEVNADCVPAMVLIAEEEATTIAEVDKHLRTALKIAEANYRKSQPSQTFDDIHENIFVTDATILFYIKRRLGMCARKMHRLREATKIFKDLHKESNLFSDHYSIHENLIEVLLEQQSYADVQAVLAKYAGSGYGDSFPISACMVYTSALLRVRQIVEKFSPEQINQRGFTAQEMTVIEYVHRAIEFNPHVAQYLLQHKRLVLPPENIVRRGDSEAVSYVFNNLNHWKRVDGALNLLQYCYEGAFRFGPYPAPMDANTYLFYPYPPASTEVRDRELMPAFHEVSVCAKKELPFFILFTAALFSITAVITLLTHAYPAPMTNFARAIVAWLYAPVLFILGKLEILFPSSILQQLTWF